MKAATDYRYQGIGAGVLILAGVVLCLVSPFYSKGMEGIQQMAGMLISGGLAAARFDPTRDERHTLSLTPGEGSTYPMGPGTVQVSSEVTTDIKDTHEYSDDLYTGEY